MSFCRNATVGLFLFSACGYHLHAQPPGAPRDIDRYVEQRVESRRGFVMRIPREARLDSARSGWSASGHFERRLYIIPNAGQILITTTVAPLSIPDSIDSVGPYRFVQSDSATNRGTAKIRTYYLPSRNVRIEIIPSSVRMRPYVEAATKIFLSFRWKPGAETNALDVDPPTLQEVPGASDPPKSSLGGS